MRRHRILPAVLCLILCFGVFACPAQAQDAPPFIAAAGASVRLSASKTQVFADDTLAVTMTLDTELQNIVSFDWQLRFDSALFTLQAVTVGGCCAEMRVSNLKTDAHGDYYSISYVDKTAQGSVLNAGEICTLTFRAADAEQRGSFSLLSEGVYDASFVEIPVAASDAVSVAVRRVLPAKLTVSKLPAKTSYNYKDKLDTFGMELSVVYTNGRIDVVKDGYVCSPDTFVVQQGLPMFGLRGDIPVTVSYAGLQTSFTVQVRLTPVQWLIKIFLFGWLWY